MIRFLSFLLILSIFSPATMAQEDADAVLAEQGEGVETSPTATPPSTPSKTVSESKAPIAALKDDNYEERLELSRKMHEIWPVRPKVENALDIVAEQIQPQERLKFKAGMRKAIKFEALEEASIDAMADIFTVKELKAMIAFYGSKEGRSVSYKTSDYERALEPVLTKMMDKALLDVKLGSQQ